MKIVGLLKKWLVPLLLAVGIVFGLNAQTARAASAQHLAILAESVQPLDSTIQFNNKSAYLVTSQNSSLSGGAQYIAQVHLPDGAVISGVHLYGIDSDSSQDVGAALYRYNLQDSPVWGAKPVAVYATTTGSAGKFSLALVVNTDVATVDNVNYSYGVYISLPKATVYSADLPTLALLRIVIDWGYVAYLPAALRQ